VCMCVWCVNACMCGGCVCEYMCVCGVCVVCVYVCLQRQEKDLNLLNMKTKHK